MSLKQLLQGQYLHLTPIQQADIPVIRRWYEDTTFARLLDTNPALPPSEVQLQEDFALTTRDPNAYHFAIRALGENQLLGWINLTAVEWHNACGWIAIAIGEREHQQKGYGTEALALLLDFAFLELNLRRVQLTVFKYNHRAIGLYEKLGFTHEGTFRERLLRDNRAYDMLLYGLLRREWFERYPDGYAGTLNRN